MIDKDEIEKNLRQALKDGDLKDADINSTFIIAWYLKKFCKVTILVDGVEYGPGWLASRLPNWETIRVVCSHIRNENKAVKET